MTADGTTDADTPGDAPALLRFDRGPRPFSRWTRVPSPIGDMYVGHGHGGVSLVRPATGPDAERDFVTRLHRITGRPSRVSPTAPDGVEEALAALDGRDLRYDLGGLGAFAQDVLAAAATIPRGEVRSYGWVAREIGRPAAVRAVGTALGRNPVPLLIPCHRVVPAGKTVGRYIFGTDAKQALLRREGYTGA